MFKFGSNLVCVLNFRLGKGKTKIKRRSTKTGYPKYALDARSRALKMAVTIGRSAKS